MLFGNREFVFKGKITDDSLYDRIKLPIGAENKAQIPEECMDLYELNVNREMLTKEINEVMGLIDQIPDEELDDVSIDFDAFSRENAEVDA